MDDLNASIVMMRMLVDIADSASGNEQAFVKMHSRLSLQHITGLSEPSAGSLLVLHIVQIFILALLGDQCLMRSLLNNDTVF